MENKKKHYKCYSYKQYKYLMTMGFAPTYSDVHRITGKRFWVYLITAKFEVALKAYTVMRDMVDSGELRSSKQQKQFSQLSNSYNKR